MVFFVSNASYLTDRSLRICTEGKMRKSQTITLFIWNILVNTLSAFEHSIRHSTAAHTHPCLRTHTHIHLSIDPHICQKSTSVILHKTSLKGGKLKTRRVCPLGDGGETQAGCVPCQFLYDIIIPRVINSRHVKISDNNNMRFNQCGAPGRPRCQVTSFKKNHTLQDFCIIALRRWPAFHQVNVKDHIKKKKTGS